jgi:hypothetical protein
MKWGIAVPSLLSAIVLLAPGTSMAGPLDPVPVGQVVGFPPRLVAVGTNYVYCVGDDPWDYDTSWMRPTRSVLEVWDAAAPASPVRVGLLRLDSVIRDIAVANGVVYLASESSGLLVVDATDPSAPWLRSSGGAAQRLAVGGSYLYVSDSTEGLRVYDIATPVSPDLVSALPCGDTPYRRVAIQGDYAYAIVEPDAFAVIDVSDPRDPKEVARLTDLQGAIGDELVAGGDRAYIVGYYPRVIDISVPTNPRYVGWFGTSDQLQAAALVGSRLYAVAGEGLCTIDISGGMPAEWTIERTDTPGHAVHLAASGSHVYLADYEGGLRVFDIASGTPTEIWGRGAPAFGHTMDVSGRLAAIAHWHGYGTQFYDVSDPAMPSYLGGGSDGDFGACVKLHGETAFFTDVGASPAYGAYDARNAAAPELLWDEGGEAAAIAADDRYAYVGVYPGLRIWDIGHAAAPVARGSCAIPYAPYDIELSGDHAYVTGLAGTLVVVDTSDRAHPHVLAEAGGPPSTCAVAISGRYAYVSAWDSLHVFDISHPAAPVEVSVLTPESGTVEALAVLGSYVYVADPHFGLRVIGVSDARNPVEAGAVAIPEGGGSLYATPFGTSGVAAQGNHVYVSVYGWGLLVFQTTSTFSDVPPDYWATDAVERCHSSSIVQGFTATTYEPTLPVSRAQMAVYISRALAAGDDGVPAPASVSFPDDVPDSHWAYRYVEYAVAAGVVQGYDATHYRPDTIVTRDQMAVFVARAKGWVTIGEAMDTAPEVFSDVPAGFWSGTAVEACVAHGVVNGYSDGAYHPEREVTRDQMAVYVTRAFELSM